MATTSRLAPTGTQRPLRAASATNVAHRILTDVVDRDWPVGEVLGSEAELIARYGVSRAVFREAVRLVENQQVASMRRGPGGGLVVTEPTVDAIIDAAVLYLHRANTRLDEVFEARIVLEEIAAELATDRLTDADAAGRQSLSADEGEGAVRDHRALRRHPQSGRVLVLPRRAVVDGGDAHRLPTRPCPHHRRRIGA